MPDTARKDQPSPNSAAVASAAATPYGHEGTGDQPKPMDPVELRLRLRDLFALKRDQADALFGPGGYAYFHEYFTGQVPVDLLFHKAWQTASLTGTVGKRVLDIGCGHGLMVSLLAAFGASEAIGIEIKPEKIDAARRIAQRLGVAGRAHFVLTDGEGVPFEDAAFDAVCIYAALSHVNDIDGTLIEAKRVLKPGGIFFAFEDNNAEHYRYRRVMEPVWHFAETGEGVAKLPHSAGDWVPYIERRRRMIGEWFPALDAGKAAELAQATKGLVREEIRDAVARHLDTGQPVMVDKTFRYYAPDTGEAMEYPFTPSMLREMVGRHFASTQIHSAWTPPYIGVKGLTKRVLKVLGAMIPPLMYLTQPTYIVTAVRPADDRR